MTYFLGHKTLLRFEKHQQVFSGALWDSFWAREVFRSFQKRTPGVQFKKNERTSLVIKTDKSIILAH